MYNTVKKQNSPREVADLEISRMELFLTGIHLHISKIWGVNSLCLVYQRIINSRVLIRRACGKKGNFQA